MISRRSGRRPNTIHVVYPFYPHYRAEVFHALGDAGIVERFTFGDTSPPLDPIPLGDATALDAVVLENRWRGNLLLWQRRLLRDLLTSRAEWVVFLGGANSLAYWFAAIAARAMGKKVAFWTIGWHRPEAGMKRMVRLAFYRLADMLLLYGDHGMVLGLEHGHAPERMRVIGNSVGGGPVTLPDRVQGQAVFGAVARLNRRKRFDLLLRAAAELGRRREGVEVWLAGDGEESAALKMLASDLGVDLRMVGPIYDDADLVAFYSRLTATVVPEAAGLTVIQSLRFGVPVVTHGDMDAQMPEAAAVHDKRTGLHFERGNEKALADVLEQCIAWRAHAGDDVIAGHGHNELNRRWTAEATRDRIIEALGLRP
jgi:glycosyltransferase involved in cell wall biosynthesis